MSVIFSLQELETEILKERVEKVGDTSRELFLDGDKKEKKKRKKKDGIDKDQDPLKVKRKKFKDKEGKIKKKDKDGKGVITFVDITDSAILHPRFSKYNLDSPE